MDAQVKAVDETGNGSIEEERVTCTGVVAAGSDDEDATVKGAVERRKDKTVCTEAPGSGKESRPLVFASSFWSMVDAEQTAGSSTRDPEEEDEGRGISTFSADTPAVVVAVRAISCDSTG